MPVHFRPGLIRWAPLDGLGRLSELQIETEAVRTLVLDVGRNVENERGLLDAERVRTRVVGAKHQHAIGRPVPVVLVVALERRPEHDVPPWARRGLCFPGHVSVGVRFAPCGDILRRCRRREQENGHDRKAGRKPHERSRPTLSAGAAPSPVRPAMRLRSRDLSPRAPLASVSEAPAISSLEPEAPESCGRQGQPCRQQRRREHHEAEDCRAPNGGRAEGAVPGEIEGRASGATCLRRHVPSVDGWA